nr:MAG TPA: hypothetical protein [Caudoviricetes sp.]
MLQNCHYKAMRSKWNGWKMKMVSSGGVLIVKRMTTWWIYQHYKNVRGLVFGANPLRMCHPIKENLKEVMEVRRTLIAARQRYVWVQYGFETRIYLRKSTESLTTNKNINLWE